MQSIDHEHHLLRGIKQAAKRDGNELNKPQKEEQFTLNLQAQTLELLCLLVNFYYKLEQGR